MTIDVVTDIYNQFLMDYPWYSFLLFFINTREDARKQRIFALRVCDASFSFHFLLIKFSNRNFPSSEFLSYQREKIFYVGIKPANTLNFGTILGDWLKISGATLSSNQR